MEIKNSQKSQLQPIIKTNVPKIDNSLTYHRWFLGMDCRKDILLENQVINKKIFQRVTPFRTRYQSKLKNNKMRLLYFVGFCGLFSMGSVYDFLILDNRYLLKLNKSIQKAFSPQSKIAKQQHELGKRMNKIQMDSDAKTRMAQLFAKVDKQTELNKQFINRIRNRNYVDIVSFLEFFKSDTPVQLKSRIQGQFPSLFSQLN